MQNEDIRRLDEQVAEKESMLNSSTTKIAQVDETLLQIEEELQNLSTERKQKEIDNDLLLSSKKDRYDPFLLFYENKYLLVICSLHLNLSKRCTTDMNVQTENDVSPTETYETTTTCETFHTAQTNCSNLSSPTIADDDDITPLSNCTLSSGEIEDDDDTISDSGIRKSKTSSPSHSNTDPNSKSSLASGSVKKSSLGVPNAIMSDSGVCLDPIKNINSVQAGSDLDKNVYSSNGGAGGDTALCNSDDETASCSSCEINPNSEALHTHCPMHSLRRKIAAQKALIMKNLEMNVNKTKLDEQIAELQELQKRYVKMEKHALQNANSMDDHQLCCSSLPEYDQNDDDNNESNTTMESPSYMMPTMTRSWPTSIRDDFCKSM